MGHPRACIQHTGICLYALGEKFTLKITHFRVISKYMVARAMNLDMANQKEHARGKRKMDQGQSPIRALPLKEQKSTRDGVVTSESFIRLFITVEIACPLGSDEQNTVIRLAVTPASYVISLCLSFLICQMG